MMLWICLELGARSTISETADFCRRLMARSFWPAAQMTPFKDINVAQRLSADDFRCWHGPDMVRCPL